MPSNEFSILDHIKKFSFWGDILIFWIVLPMGVLLLPMPWDIIVVCAGGLIAGSSIEFAKEGLHQTPYSTSYRKISWYFAAICFVATCLLTYWAVLRYQEERWMGLWFGYTAARSMAVVLTYFRQLANRTILPEDPPPPTLEPKGRPAPIMPKLPTMDASGTLTLPTQEK